MNYLRVIEIINNDEQEKVDAKHQSHRKKICLMLQESQGK